MGKQVSLPDQPAYLEALRSEYEHTIIVLDHTQETNLPLESYTCFAYALGLATSPHWHKFSLESFAINTNFVEKLLTEGVLVEVSPAQASDGDLVIYFDPRPKHAGIKRGDTIVSKWGTGWLCQHDLFEVASHQGDTVRFYRRPSLESVEETLRAHLQTPNKYYVPDERDDEDEAAEPDAG